MFEFWSEGVKGWSYTRNPKPGLGIGLRFEGSGAALRQRLRWLLLIWLLLCSRGFRGLGVLGMWILGFRDVYGLGF